MKDQRFVDIVKCKVNQENQICLDLRPNMSWSGQTCPVRDRICPVLEDIAS
jgi:hypothetical protein